MSFRFFPRTTSISALLLAALCAFPQTSRAQDWSCNPDWMDHTLITCSKSNPPDADIYLALAGTYSGGQAKFLSASDTQIPSQLFTNAAQYRSGTVTVKINIEWEDCDSIVGREIIRGLPGSLLDSSQSAVFDVCWRHRLPMVVSLTQKNDGKTLRYTGSGVTLIWSNNGKTFEGFIKNNVSQMSSSYDYPPTNDYFTRPPDRTPRGIQRASRFTQQDTNWSWHLYSNRADVLARAYVEIGYFTAPAPGSTPPPTGGGTTPDPGSTPGSEWNPGAEWQNWFNSLTPDQQAQILILYEQKPDKWVSQYVVGPLPENITVDHLDGVYKSVQAVINNIRKLWGIKLLGPVTITILEDYKGGSADFSGLSLNGQALTITGKDDSSIGGLWFSNLYKGGKVEVKKLELSDAETACINVLFDAQLSSNIAFTFSDLTFNHCPKGGINIEGNRAKKFSFDISNNTFEQADPAITFSSLLMEERKLNIVKNQFSSTGFTPAVQITGEGSNLLMKYNTFEEPSVSQPVMQRSNGGGTFQNNISHGTFEFKNPIYSHISLFRNTLIAEKDPVMIVESPQANFSNKGEVPIIRAYRNIFGPGPIRIESIKNLSPLRGNIFDRSFEDPETPLIQNLEGAPDPSGTLANLNSLSTNTLEPNFIIRDFTDRYLGENGHLRLDVINAGLVGSNRKETAKLFGNFNTPLKIKPNDPPIVYKSGNNRREIDAPVDWSYDDPDIDGEQITVLGLKNYAGADGLNTLMPDYGDYLLELRDDDKSSWDSCFAKDNQVADNKFAKARDLEMYLQAQPETTVSLWKGANLFSDQLPNDLSEADKKRLVAQRYAYMNEAIDGELGTLEKIVSINSIISATNGQRLLNIRPDYVGDRNVPETVAWAKKLKNCDTQSLTSNQRLAIDDAYNTFVHYERLRTRLAAIHLAVEDLVSLKILSLADRLADHGTDRLEALQEHMERVSPWLKAGPVRDALNKNPKYWTYHAFRNDEDLLAFNFEPEFKKHLEGLLEGLWGQYDQFAKMVSCLNPPNSHQAGMDCGDFTKTLAGAPHARSWNIAEPSLNTLDSAQKAGIAQYYLGKAECITRQRNLSDELKGIVKDGAINAGLVVLTAATMGATGPAAAAIAAGRTLSTAARFATTALWAADVGFAVQGGIKVAEICGGDKLKNIDAAIADYDRQFEPSCPNTKLNLSGPAALYSMNDCIWSATVDGLLNAIPGALALKVGPAVLRAQATLGRVLSLKEMEGVTRASERGLAELGRDGKNAGITRNRTVSQLEQMVDDLSRSGVPENDIPKLMENEVVGLSAREMSQVLQRAKTGITLSTDGTSLAFKLGRTLSDQEIKQLGNALEKGLGYSDNIYSISKEGVLTFDLKKIDLVEREALKDAERQGQLLDALMSKDPDAGLRAFGQRFLQDISALLKQPADILKFMQEQKAVVSALDLPAGGVHIGDELIKFGNGVSPETVWKNAIESALAKGKSDAALEIAFNGVRSGVPPEVLFESLRGKIAKTNSEMDGLARSLQSQGRLIDAVEVKTTWLTRTINPKDVAENSRAAKKWLTDFGITPSPEDTLTRIQLAYIEGEKTYSRLFVEMIDDGIFQMGLEDLKKIPIASKPTSQTALWNHPEFRTRLKELIDKGYSVALDDSARLLNVGGYYKKDMQLIGMRIDSTWQTFVHENSHLLFDEAITKAGGFSKYVKKNPPLSKKAIEELAKTDPMRARATDLYQQGATQLAIEEVLATDAEVALLVKEGVSATSIRALEAKSYGFEHIIAGIKQLGLKATEEQVFLKAFTEAQLQEMKTLTAAQLRIAELTPQQANVVKLTSALIVGGSAVVITDKTGHGKITWTDPQTNQKGELTY